MPRGVPNKKPEVDVEGDASVEVVDEPEVVAEVEANDSFAEQREREAHEAEIVAAYEESPVVEVSDRPFVRVVHAGCGGVGCASCVNGLVTVD